MPSTATSRPVRTQPQAPSGAVGEARHEPVAGSGTELAPDVEATGDPVEHDAPEQQHDALGPAGRVRGAAPARGR